MGIFEESVFDAVSALVPNIRSKLDLANPESLAEIFHRSAKAANIYGALVADKKAEMELKKGAGYLNNIGDYIETGQNIRTNSMAALGIYVAWNEIDPNNIRSDPERYARAFGSLFKYAGVFARNLPFPLSTFASFLEGFEDFFSDMYKLTDLEGPHRYGRGLRGAIRQTDKY